MSNRGLSKTIEAERNLVGNLIEHSQILPSLSISVDDFGESRLRAIFAEMARLDADQVSFDLVTLRRALERSGKLDAAGGPVYLAGLVDGLVRVSAVQLEKWVGIIRDGSKRRRMIAAGEALKRAADEAENVAEGFDEARREFDEVERRVLGFEHEPGAGVPAALKKLRTPVRALGNRSGIADLDQKLGPIEPGNLIVIGARPKTGKTIACVQWAENTARAGRGVLMISAEMSEDEINGRRILCESGISQERIHRGLGIQDNRELDEAAERVASRPFFILAGSPTPTEIRAHARMVGAKPCGLGLIVVDYLQLLAPLAGKYQNRETLVAATSRAFKKLAGEIGVPVILACQLNRDPDKEEREPRLPDLRESGAIEQDADVVILLHRIADSEERVAAIVAKARNWREGRAEIRLRGELFRFESYAHSEAQSAA